MSESAASEATAALPIKVVVKVDQEQLAEWKLMAKWLFKGFARESLYMMGIVNEPFSESPPWEKEEGSGSVNWNRTRMANDRIAVMDDGVPPKDDKPAPHGRYKGRRIIGSNMSDIIEGVYLGGNGREAIVVDDDPHGMLKNAFEKFLKTLEANPAQADDEEKMCTLLMKYVSATFSRSDGDLAQMLKEYDIKDPDQKISLSAFVIERVGVCRHRALLVGYILQRLMSHADKRYQLRGSFSIERNSIRYAGAHAWVVYKGRWGKRIVIDAMQEVVGPMNKVMKQPGAWQYDREEKSKKWWQRK